MKDIYVKIKDYVEAHKEEMLQKFEQLVNLEGHFNEKEKVEKARAWVQKELEQEGFECYIREVAEDKAGILVANLGNDRPGKPVMFTGHVDTVHYAGSFGKENPFYVEDGKVYGPGVLDMKGGIIIALYAVKALNSIGYEERPIRFVIVSEEESDHVGNDGDQILTEESKGALCAFNMECGELQNRLCTNRKSQFTYYLKIDGVGGHAGNDFWRGKNAIHEMMYKLQEIVKLTDKEKETTVTVATIQGGGHTSGIAEHCEAVVDVRICTEEEAQRVMDAMYTIAGKAFIEGTTTKLDYYRAKLAPLREDEKVTKFHAYVNEVAEECGYQPFGKIFRGGATDAGNVARGGVPVLDACGIIGDFAHSKKEYAVLQSLYDRTVIFASAAATIEEL